MMPRVLSCLPSGTRFVLHRKYSREILLFSCIELNLGGNTNNGKVCLCKIEYYIISQANGFVNRFYKSFLKSAKKMAGVFIQPSLNLQNNLKSDMCCILLIRRNLTLMLLDDCFCHGKPYAVAACEFSRLIGAVEAVKQAV